MKIILLQDIPKIGKKYEVKNVSDGYAVNFLFPKKLAEQATDTKVAALSAKQTAQEEERKVQDDLLTKNLESLKDIRVEISAKANEKGHLFKSIRKDEVLAALKEQKHINLPEDALVFDEPVKQIGEHAITVTALNASASFTLSVLKEK